MTIEGSMAEASHFERLGGEAGLRVIIEDFVGRVMSDMMIGFHFRGVDRARLVVREFEFAREHLGGEGTYSGRPLGSAHASVRILGGQFNRRLRLLEKTLEDHSAPRDVIDAWLSHNESLRGQVTQDDSTECND